MATDFRTTAVRGSGAADQGGVEPTIRWPQQAHSASGGELVPTQPLSSSQFNRWPKSIATVRCSYETWRCSPPS
ncbi:hypothetical protein I553_3998 [Mycobacterium xenopi 4042]|nr:hypothetical protein I553_3998 [Mycobacterium xenopi 4042]